MLQVCCFRVCCSRAESNEKSDPLKAQYNAPSTIDSIPITGRTRILKIRSN